MKKYILRLCLSVLVFSCALNAFAQESTAQRSQSTLQSITNSLDVTVDEYDSRIEAVHNKLRKLATCMGKTRAQALADPACGYPTEYDPHVADFADLRKTGLPTCTDNEFLQSTGPYTFKCVDAAPYVPIPDCSKGSKYIHARVGSTDHGCSVTLNTSAIGSERLTSCTSRANRKFDVTAKLICHDTGKEAVWKVMDNTQSARQVRFDNCSSRRVSLGGYCSTYTGSTILHTSDKSISCSSGNSHATATAHCYDGAISLSGVSGWHSRWYVGYYGSCSSSCGGGVQYRTVYCENARTGGRVSSSYCAGYTPSSSTSCNTHSCNPPPPPPPARCPPGWIESAYNSNVCYDPSTATGYGKKSCSHGMTLTIGGRCVYYTNKS